MVTRQAVLHITGSRADRTVPACIASLVRYFTLRLAALAWFGAVLPAAGFGAEQQQAAAIAALVPSLESYITREMTEFDSPGLAIGIVADDRLVYAKGFGARSKAAT